MKKIAFSLLAFVIAMTAGAQNPVIQSSYTPDPAPYVHNDTVYLFVDHDETVERKDMFNMKDWLLYSSTDMVNWTYRGKPMDLKTFKWAYQETAVGASPQCRIYTLGAKISF